MARDGGDDDGDEGDEDDGGDGDDGDDHDDSVGVPAAGAGHAATDLSRAAVSDKGGDGGAHGRGREHCRCPDAFIMDNGQVNLRRERQEHGNGRVYAISFAASDRAGGECSGTVYVCVPSKRHAGTCVDDGQTVNSLGPCLARSASPVRLGVDALALSPRTSTGSEVTLEFAVPEESDVVVVVFDVSGTRLATLENSRQTAGWHAVTWRTSGVPSGIYFVRLRAGSRAITKAVQVLR